jgi:hypothetical protein
LQFRACKSLFVLQVGHNALGGGKITDQGSVLVDKAIKSGDIFTHDCWQGLEGDAKKNTLHLIGLLSDGGVHARLDQLIPLMDGVPPHPLTPSLPTRVVLSQDFFQMNSLADQSSPQV